MSGLSSYQQTSTYEYFNIASRVFYAITGVVFLAGLYYDWKLPGEVVVSMFRIANEPRANSGLFILSFLIFAVGYASSGIGSILESRDQPEPEDQTQEWTVDISSSE